MVEDLKVKIGTPAEAEWTRILAQSKELLVSGEANTAINKAIIEIAEKRIAEEKEKA